MLASSGIKTPRNPDGMLSQNPARLLRSFHGTDLIVGFLCINRTADFEVFIVVLMRNSASSERIESTTYKRLFPSPSLLSFSFSAISFLRISRD